LTNHIADHKIVDLIKQRNHAGCRLFYEKYSPPLFGAIIHIIKDKTIAEQLLQEMFEKALKNIDQYDADQLTFLTWALQLARSASIEYLCITKQKPTAGNFSENHTAAVSVTGSNTIITIPVVDKNEAGQIFNMALRGYKAGEIAGMLNMDIGIVRINIRKGMKLKVNRT
jgi:DNA-directed RNA polymerase specialized sigma24 family protein